MGNYSEAPYVMVGVRVDLNSQPIKDFLKTHNLVPDGDGERQHSWDPHFLRRNCDPEGTKRYQLKCQMGNVDYVGKVIASGYAVINPAELEKILVEVRNDLPEAEVFVCSAVNESDG